MTDQQALPRYGVIHQTTSADEVERVAEAIRTFGYAVLDSGLSPAEINSIRARFDAAREKSAAEYGEERLKAIGEHNTIRCPLAIDPIFLDLAMNKRVLALAKNLMRTGVMLNQQNGIINPGSGGSYSQSLYHRDLPYQHFVSSRPLALNALYCVDDFTSENGSTLVVPATHKEEAFPSDDLIRAHEKTVTAPAGSFIVLDCMVYHRGGENRSGRDRRAVNHVYTIGLMRQQLDLPAYLGDGFTDDPETRALLGFNFGAPRSPAEYYEQREGRARN